jgi:hypothetical protein
MANPKMNTLFFLVVGLVFLFVLLVSSSHYIPYDNEKTNYAKYEAMTDFASTGASESPALVATNQPADFAPLADAPKTIQYGKISDPDMFDKIGPNPKNGVDGVDGCISSGFSNAGGAICLSPEMIQMLKSRGGNATGGSV